MNIINIQSITDIVTNSKYRGIYSCKGDCY